MKQRLMLQAAFSKMKRCQGHYFKLLCLVALIAWWEVFC